MELCGPAGCGVVAGPAECRTSTKIIAGERPEEECSLEPQRQCKHVTKLVPQLKPTETCTEVPKEVKLSEPTKKIPNLVSRCAHAPGPTPGR